MLILNGTWQSAEMSPLSLHHVVVTSDLPADLSVTSPLAHMDEQAATEEKPRVEELRAAPAPSQLGREALCPAAREGLSSAKYHVSLEGDCSQWSFR